MMTPPRDDSRITSESIAYFMIRLRRAEDAAGDARLSGMIEQLGTGEKRSFNDAAELLQLLTLWGSVTAPVITAE